MDNKVVKTVNLLPESLRTDKNSKFLASTLDQLVQPPQLERIDGYIGSKLAPTYNSTDTYISESNPLRAAYQLSPALIVNDRLGAATDVISFDDLVNDISTRGGSTENFDRLFRTNFYSYNPHIDWDKLINYQDYYWLEYGPDAVTITVTDIDAEILNEASYIATVSYTTPAKSVTLTNGMKVTFSSLTDALPEYYQNKEFIVEGVGTAIKLIDFSLLVPSSKISNSYADYFSNAPFDQYSFDSVKSIPVTPEYITINRASKDLNPWSRYNRWTHKDVIKLTALANDQLESYPADKRAMRPIVEFVADLKLYNFGSIGTQSVDLIDTTTTDIRTVINSPGFYVDGVLLADGHRVIFNVVANTSYLGNIYKVKYVADKLTLTVDTNLVDSLVAGITYGKTHAGSSWWLESGKWKLSQQHTKLNQAPLFDLFDADHISYADKAYDLSNFTGNKIFGYNIGTGSPDPVLGFPLKYKTISTVSNYLFKNYFMTDSFNISIDNTVVSVPSSHTYFKVANQYSNVWKLAAPYNMPIIQPKTVSDKAYYELPLGLTNNPLNTAISTFTLSELGENFKSMISRFQSSEISNANLPNISEYGTRLISNENPIAFAQMFLGKKDHNVLDAISHVSDHYNQFKMTFLKRISEYSNITDSVILVDTVLADINRDKNSASLYFLSDMLAYGTDKISTTCTITNPNIIDYYFSSEFNLTSLSLRSVLVYLNGVQLTFGKDYVFKEYDSAITVMCAIVSGDTLSIVDYANTEGSFVPPTPTKLGLYPKYEPTIYLDTTYINPTWVIQGHDGSITVAYNDYRDAALLEFEKRVFNNIKSQYRSELFDINLVSYGAFKDNVYSLDEITKIIQPDFIKWAGTYAADYTLNSTVIDTNPFTWNYVDGYVSSLSKNVSGYWRAAYKYLYGTDRPHSHPWEMLGFAIQPSWWISKYGSAPYLPSNEMWVDLEAGRHWENDLAVINLMYARPNLSSILPVDSTGSIIAPSVIISNTSLSARREEWKFGDQGPVETAWRRSSYMPFTIQRLLALTKPAVYAALMYDVSRMAKNQVGQWVYGENSNFLNLKDVSIHADDSTLTSGYSVYVSEIGKLRSTTYISELKSDLTYANFNLFYKVGGFVSKDKLQVVIDAYDPASTSPGLLLPQEDCNLILNVSNPVKTASISGIIIQKINGYFVLKGYDRVNPYFNIFTPVRTTNTAAMTVGGVSEPYITWSAGSLGIGNFYQQGQLVAYGSKFYLTKISHRSSVTFDVSYFQVLSELPINGGATVQLVDQFDTTVAPIAYGTKFSRIQDVYDVIIGYGMWLENQGFIFDEFNSDLGSMLDWNFSAKEFLYWTTQNWADNSVLTLSPFADKIKYSQPNTIVDNIFDSFYEYSLLLASGLPFPRHNLSVDRQDGICTISTSNTDDGMYFATLHSVQKEHAIIFNNTTIFNDTIYDITSGYRQLRMKLSGFRTSGWNGDYFSPGFVYDNATVTDWTKHTDYQFSDVVQFNGLYYSANKNVKGSAQFDFTKWAVLNEKPVAGLLPNFDYKINQFEDFYSLDIDNFDSAQQKMAQHLTGYTPRVYLNNIFTNPIAQYKFYQGFIKEKGTKNSVSKLAKASIYNLQGEITYTEEWAFRIGQYGSYSTYNELEIPLAENKIVENPQIINFINTETPVLPNDTICYSTPADVLIAPSNYIASQTFSTSNDEFKLNTAGYARLDDITATAYTENSLLDIANNENITEGDAIWLGFKRSNSWGNSNGDGWDVLRYTQSLTVIINAVISVPGSEVTFTTRELHNLSAGQLISISQYDSTLNGVYVVKSTPTLTEFTVTTSLTYINTLELPGHGLLFEFTSIRFNSVDSLPADHLLLSLPIDTKLWVDNGGSTADSGRWAVYQKVQNYSKLYDTPGSSTKNLHLGRAISQGATDGILVVSATNNSTSTSRIFVYDTNLNAPLFNYSFNELKNVYTTSSLPTGFGNSLAYDDYPFIDINLATNTSITKYGLIFAGAPLASDMRTSGITGSVQYSTGNETIGSSYINQGAVKISSIDYTLAKESSRAYVLLSPEPTNYEQYGHSLLVEHNTSTKLLLVGAPGSSSTGTGAVYAYTVTNSTSTTNSSTKINVAPHISGIKVSVNLLLSVGDQWGYAISGSDNAGVIVISAPGYQQNTGLISIYTDKNLHNPQIINGSQLGSRFGETVLVSPTGDYIFIAAPLTNNQDHSLGIVKVFVNVNGEFIESTYSTITNPVSGYGMQFGTALSINLKSNMLAISAIGDKHIPTTFDLNRTVFDSPPTTFYDVIRNSGSVYLYNRKAERFVLTEEVPTTSVQPDTYYGRSVIIADSNLFIGAPSINSSSYGIVYEFNSSAVEDGLYTLREQDDLVIVNALQKVTILDSYKEEIVDYLEIIDPLKGKISGLADQELKYKSSFDPAVYSIGVSNSTVDSTSNWLDDRVGELWWDLNTVKYTWYEQGDLAYRKNSWGTLFPGSTIDVYEWVGSEYLPSEWSSLADTAAGLVNGISGQPKYVDNSVISVKQIYNSISNAFSNYYFYWVKNKTTVPTAINRRISGYEVANIIADPTAYGLKYASILSKDAISLSNINTLLVDDRMHLNLSSDIIDNGIPRHTEWALLQEHSVDSMPTALLEKKLIDSLLGHDSLGNPVPDPTLSFRSRYGISIRPRQTLFKDRLSALRNLVEFTNSILIENQIVDNYNFDNLNSQELVPDMSSNEYDQIVEDELNLQLIDTRLLKIAKITTQEIVDGKLTRLYIDEPGFGYITPPTVRVVGNNIEPATITTEIDDSGRVISAKIVNAGTGYTETPVIEVRPYSVIVLVDSLYNNKWTRFIYNAEKQWVRSNTQKFNTTLYWKYIDWQSDTYDQFKDFTATLSALNQLSSADFSKGQYVKIKNSGNGKYIVLARTDDTGTFIRGFDLVYREHGTIQLLDDIWNYSSGKFGFDQRSSYDQTLYDQTPDIELQRILAALKNDIFVNELKVNWNLFFFNAVKYALSEQKNLDWAFKTSFINVKNLAGNLDQRPVYKLQDSAYYEQYLKEVKPYHTNIRSFTTDYTVLDTSNTSVDDTSTTCTNVITMKFDRISRSTELVNALVTDQLVCDGFNAIFNLTWLSTTDKTKILVTLDGSWVLGADYIIDTVSEFQNGYHKEISKIVFLNYIPKSGQILAITYEKNIKLFNAADRVVSYYTTTNWMPALDLSQTMSGIDYPGTIINGLQFNHGIAPPFSRWDIDYVSYDETPWATNVDSYHTTVVNSTSTVDTNTLILQSIDNIIVGQNVNVISEAAVFNTSEDVTVTSVDPIARTITVSAALAIEVYPNTVVEFWNYDSAAEVMNYKIESGGMDTTADAYISTIDGDQFITPANSYAPEELVPGRVADSLAINVYTKTSIGSPTIFTGYADTYAGFTTTAVLSVVPINLDSINVSLNNTMLKYTPTANFTTSTEYTIDWATKSIIVPPQSKTGQLGYTVLGIGGGMSNIEAGVLDDSYVVTDELTINVYSASTTAKSAYVTVNGISTTDYELKSSLNPTSCCYVAVKNLPPGTNLVHAWFFSNLQKYHNVVTEQRFTVGNTAQSAFPLLHAPGNLGPVEDKIIIELYDGIKRVPLISPFVSYHEISDLGINEFAVDTHKSYPAETFTLSNVRAYLNGIQMRSDFDYKVISATNTIIVNSNLLSIGSTIAVIGLPENNYAYSILGSTLTLTTAISNVELKVITYANHDSMSIRTDSFTRTSNKRYKIRRPVVNDNYVWVRINGIPLTNRLDYVILDDQVTVQLGDSIQNSNSDIVVITSIISEPLASTVVGYRMFNDIFGRNHYKRLSKENTTYLTQPLLYTDTEITVADSGVLTPPIVSKKIPGVVIINGERIEFLKIDGNKLTQLRRGTLGSSPSPTSIIGTKVIDQGIDQNIPFSESVYKQTHITTSTNTYTISQVSNETRGDGITLIADLDPVDQVSVYYGGKLLRKTAMLHQDISLSYDSPVVDIIGSIVSTADLPIDTISIGTAYIVTSTNQIWSYTNSAGVAAINGYEYHGLNYLPPEFSISVSTSTIVIANVDVNDNTPPTGSGWVLHETTATMQIQPGWIMQDANGYQNTVIYSGHNPLFNGWGVGFANAITITWPITFIEPKLQQLSLNIDGTITAGTLIKVVQKLGHTWAGTASLLTSDNIQAKFLQARPAELPDNHYYSR